MDRMSSIELALKNEETEMKFYRGEAARSKNPVAKAMFDTLARDEQEHMERIKGLHGKLVESGAWPDAVTIEVAGTNIKEVLEGLVGQQGSAEDQTQDDIAAIKRGIEFETQGEKFYRELAEACTNPKEKEFFRFLSGIEREHRLSLTDTLGYLESPENWLEEHEKSGLDGA
jgi:rubrerythrin